MEKDKKLLTYREFGYTPHEYYDYRFQVSNDYQCNLEFLVRSLDKEAKDETPTVHLLPEEIRTILLLCMQLQVHPVQENVVKDSVSSYSISLHGEQDKEFVNDSNLKGQADQVMKLIRSNHMEELGEQRVAGIYNAMMQKIGSTEVTKPVVK